MKKLKYGSFLIVLIFLHLIIKQDLFFVRPVKAEGKIILPPQVEVCLGEIKKLTVTSRADQEITGYVFAFDFDQNMVEIEDVDRTWSIKDGDLKVSSHIFNNPQKDFQINVNLKGAKIGNSKFKFLETDSWMGGIEDEDINISVSGESDVKVINCEKNSEFLKLWKWIMSIFK
jgi:hypothetical protein